MPSPLRCTAAATAALAMSFTLAAPVSALTRDPEHSATTASVADGAARVNTRTAQPLNEKILWSETFDRQADATGSTAPRAAGR